MKKRIIKIFFLSLTGCLLATNVFAVSWLPLVPCGRQGLPECSLCHIWQLVSNLINFVIFGLTPPIAAFLFVIAGITLLTAGGNESKVATAKQIFTTTVVGLAIIFCSWLVVDTAVKTIVNPSTESGRVIWAWNQFPSCH